MNGLELSEEEKKELSTNLLREFWLTTVQALTDLAGEDTAIERLTPYQTNAAIATSRNLPDLLNIRESSLQTDQYLMSLVHGLMFSTTGRRFQRGKNEIIAVVNDCSTKGNLMALCKAVCDVGGRAFSESFCPDIDYHLTASLSSGDQSCIFTWRDKKSIDDGDLSEQRMEDVTINEAIRNDLSPHFFAEMWTFSTRAFLDFSRDPSDFEKLATYLYHSGIATGMRLVDKYGEFAGHDSSSDLFEALWKLHHPASRFRKSAHALECTVEECPFSDGPVELCQQFDSFFNGICEAIDPNLGFSYDRMMTKGDKSCHWMIRRKDPASIAMNEKKSSDKEDMLRSLKWRLVKGEISKGEYEELRSLVQE